MTTINGKLHCDMELDCVSQVTHIDVKGWVYCRGHGIDRKDYCRCRQLTTREARTLAAGGRIHYNPKLNRKPA